MDPVISYRMTNTGIWSYHFHAGGRMMGKAVCELSLASVVRVESAAVSWYSVFRMNTDNGIVPGFSRKVMDDRTDREVFRILYCEPGFYRIMAGEKSLLVEYRDEAYLFGNPGQPVLAMTERIRDGAREQFRGAGEPFFRTRVYEDLPAGAMMAMLAFPMLRF